MGEEENVIPSEYIEKDGIRYIIVPDENYASLQPLTRFTSSRLMMESTYKNGRAAENQVYESKMRDIQLRMEKLNQLKREQDVIDGIMGRRPRITRRVGFPMSQAQLEEGGFIDDYGEDDDEEEEDLSEYEDLEE